VIAALLVAAALAADGDALGPVTLGAPVPRGLTCREDACQGRGEAYGEQGTLAVSRCEGVAIRASLSVSRVADSGATRRAFGSYMRFEPDPSAAALAAWTAWRDAHLADGWVVESAGEEAGLPWARLVRAPHARLVRVTRRDAIGHPVWTTSIAAAATSVDCPR
jgi:hypothetical protein